MGIGNRAATGTGGAVPGTALTRALLAGGIAAGPFYLAIGVAQALTREGFDFGRHPLSVLANGPGGWIQVANFLVTGILVSGAAAAFARVPGPRMRALTWCLGAFGASMIVAAFCPADAMDGFPPGTPLGPPTTISTTGLLHFAAGALGFAFLGVSGLVAARSMARRNAASVSRLSLLAGLVVLVGFFGGIALPIGIAGIWIAVVVGFAWLSTLSRHLLREA